MKQKSLFIIGMHRSGTSALSRVINLLGVALGGNLYPAQTHNPRGLWEHKEVVQIHEELFRYLGHPWIYYLEPLPEDWWEDPGVDLYRQKLNRIVIRDFKSLPFWGLKDPRLSRLLPIWYSIFEENGCEPYFVHIIRNPHEVAASLKKRNNLPKNMSMLLWLQHVLESEKNTRNYSRCFVTFNQLLSNCKDVTQKIERSLEIKWPVKYEKVANEINEFLSPELKHFNMEDSGENTNSMDIPNCIEEVYQLISDPSSNRDRSKEERLDYHYDLLRGSITTEPTKMLIEDLRKLIPEFGKLVYTANKHDQRLKEIVNSRSWKITTPLRTKFISNLLNRPIKEP